MAYLALSPVSAAVYSTLNVAAMTVLAPGGVYDDVPQAVSFPFVFFEVQEEDVRGFGTGGMPEVTLRVHAYSTYAGMKEAQSIIAKAIELLRDASLGISGYRQAGRVVYRETVALADELINGVKCKELVAIFTLWAEE